MEVRGMQRPPSYQTRTDRRSRDRDRPRRRDASRGRSPRSVSSLPVRQGDEFEGDSDFLGVPRILAPEPGAKFFERPASSDSAFNILNVEGATSLGLPPLSFGSGGEAGRLANGANHFEQLLARFTSGTGRGRAART